MHSHSMQLFVPLRIGLAAERLEQLDDADIVQSVAETSSFDKVLKERSLH
jgi:hypothetical protein